MLGGCQTHSQTARGPSADPVYLATAVVGSLIQPLPAGTAYFIGVVLITLMTGRFMQCKGSLGRKWGQVLLFASKSPFPYQGTLTMRCCKT